MSRSRKPAPDADLFAAVMRGVKPLRRPRAAPPTPSSATHSAPAVPARPAAAPSGGAVQPQPMPPNPGIANPGIDRRTAERLRKGEMAIDRRLDLHGMTEANAHAALDRFVRQAWQAEARVLLIITGKGSVGQGGGVLRRNLPRWLASGEHAPRVLRVEPAQARHGGSGAYYVLLRRQRGRSGAQAG